MRVGDLVCVRKVYPNSAAIGIRAYREYPASRAYRDVAWIEHETLGVLLEVQQPFVRLLVADTELWVESYNVSRAGE